jgi:hypothetical protein
MKKIYRIELKRNGTIASELAMLAALSNGGNYTSLKEMEAIVKTQKIQYPASNDGITCSLIGDNVLTIDKETENILVLTEVEIMEIKEEEDILDELNPILERGLNNPDNHELLN